MSDALANQGCGRANAHQDKIMTFARRRNAPLCLKHITIISRSKIVVFQCDNFFFLRWMTLGICPSVGTLTVNPTVFR